MNFLRNFDFLFSCLDCFASCYYLSITGNYSFSDSFPESKTRPVPFPAYVITRCFYDITLFRSCWHKEREGFCICIKQTAESLCKGRASANCAVINLLKKLAANLLKNVNLNFFKQPTHSCLTTAHEIPFPSYCVEIKAGITHRLFLRLFLL
jgi:hypothetical protein